jgi:hypothetical protein
VLLNINFEGEIIKGAEKKIEEFANRYFEGYPVSKTKVMVGCAALILLLGP